MSELRERLIALEPLIETRNEKLQQEIEAMFEPKMSRFEKLYWGFSVAGFAVSGLCTLAVAAFVPAELSLRLVWGLLGLGNVVAAVFVFAGLRRGSINLKQQFAAGKASVGVAMLIAVLLLMNAIAWPSLVNLAWGLFGVLGLVLAAAIALHNRVMAAELDSRERLLKLEYRLADLIEKLEGRKA
jgi:hypothetical protein